MPTATKDGKLTVEPDVPFVLIAGRRLCGLSAGEIETAIRHIGLRPERIDAGAAGDPVAPVFRLRFGSIALYARGATARVYDDADPARSTTSLIGASLPADWRNGDGCWIVTLEGGGEQYGEPHALREYFKALVLLIDLFDVEHIFWSPASLWSGAQPFRDAVVEMLVSGMPPILHLVAFRRDADDMVRTRGLALFGGQEIEGRVPHGWTVADMVRRLARLALDIILNGPIPDYRRMRGLEPGEWVTLEPIPGGEAGPMRVRVEFGDGA